MTKKEWLQKYRCDEIDVNTDDSLGDLCLFFGEADKIQMFRECGWDDFYEIGVFGEEAHYPSRKMTDEELIEKINKYIIISLEEFLEDYDEDEEFIFGQEDDQKLVFYLKN